MLSPDTEEVLAAFGEVLEAPYMIYERSRTSVMRFSSFTTEDGTEYPLTLKFDYVSIFRLVAV
ncbi:hypothetical protein [Paenibacillus sp. JCM 10914]|nr:hypothetical protein [Paenibacillus sp. JCM 10914]